jgi:hypothetical protein
MALMFSPLPSGRYLNIYSGNLVINTTSETPAIPFDVAAGDDPTLYDNGDWTTNSYFTTTLIGSMSTPLIGLGTLTLRAYLGNTLICNTSGLSLTAGLSNTPFSIKTGVLLLPSGSDLAARGYIQFTSPAGNLMSVSHTDTVFANVSLVYGYGVTAQLSSGSSTQFLTIDEGYVEWIYQ